MNGRDPVTVGQWDGWFVVCVCVCVCVGVGLIVVFGFNQATDVTGSAPTLPLLGLRGLAPAATISRQYPLGLDGLCVQ